jgi:hypothetical protein
MEMEKYTKRSKLSKTVTENLLTAQTYFANNRQRMNYAEHVAQDLPIDTGVTEAACKTLVKQHLCCSGMRWRPPGAKVILSLRPLIQSKGLMRTVLGENRSIWCSNLRLNTFYRISTLKKIAKIKKAQQINRHAFFCDEAFKTLNHCKISIS